MMTYPKIKPCPNCGDDGVDIYEYESGWKHVECHKCNWLGPGEGRNVQAIRSWNARADAMIAEGEKP